MRLIRSKLTNARVVLSRDVEPDVATGGSRIAFSIDGAPSIVRVLAHWAEGRPPSDSLAVHSLVGATLLGMRAGQHSLLPRHDAPFGMVRLEEVVHQPESTRHGASREVKDE
jgi:regulator of nucleoside diphosphate kinase